MSEILNSNWNNDMLTIDQWEETAQSIDEYVELKEWNLIKLNLSPIEKVAFVDGIVRLDTEIFDRHTKARIKLISLASGVCEINPFSYNDFNAFKNIKTKKIAISDKAINYKSIYSSHANYELIQVDSNYLTILKNMEQESLSEYTTSTDTSIIVWDGSLPITFKGIPNKYVFGLIKSHKKYFISDKNLQLIYDIKSFTRTPIIHYTSQDGDKYYYTWYSTLNDDITGLIRFEILADFDVEKAKYLANQISFNTIKFASSPIFEQRAPQNLSPISTLESYLRAQIGDYFVDKFEFC